MGCIEEINFIIKNRLYKRKLLFFTLIIFGLVLIFSSGIDCVAATTGDTVYVNDQSGNDSWNGLSSTYISGVTGPKHSIKNATGTIGVNGTVRIANGIYTEIKNDELVISNNMTLIGQSRNGTIIKYHFIQSINDGCSVTITNLTITGAIYGDGGAIRKNGGDLTLNNVTFTDNKAVETGGAISNTKGNLWVNNCIFTGNYGGQLGPGGIGNWGNLTVYNSSFTGNDGAINNYGNASIMGSTFTANTASTLGTINNFGNLTINYSRIYGNIGGKSVFNDIYDYPLAYADLMYNWWGTNNGPRSEVEGVMLTEWLMLTISVNPATIPTIGHSTVTADLLHDNYGNLVTGTFPDGNTIKFLTNLGKITSTSPMINMVSVSNFNSTLTGTANINATMDAQTVSTTVKVVTLTAKANVASGLYNVNKVVTLSMTEAGNIYYTLNGTTPTTASTRYTGPITISSSKILKLIAVDGSGYKSPIYTYTYTIDKTPPKVSVTTPANLKTGVARTSNVVIKFSEVFKSSTYFKNISVKNASTGKYLALSKLISGNTLTIRTSSKTANTWYIVTIPKAAIKDNAGNNLAANYTFKFKTGN